MKIDKNLTAKLAYTANSTNTVSGGMTEMKFSSTKNEEEYIVNMTLPGITAETLNVEINDNLILLFLNLDQRNDEYNNYLLTYFQIPYNVNVDLIEAGFKGQKLVITMPFDELNDGYARKLNIL